MTHPDQASTARDHRDPELDACLLALRHQDAAALARLYDAAGARLYTLALRITSCAADAEEVVVDVFQHAWTHADDYDPARGGALTWLSMLAWSRSVDRRRRQRPEQSTTHPNADPDTYAGAQAQEDPLSAFIDGARVRQALASLREEQRSLILMAFFEGASHGDIATRTGLPLGTVKSHIRRGMDALRAALGGPHRE